MLNEFAGRRLCEPAVQQRCTSTAQAAWPVHHKKTGDTALGVGH